MDNLKTISTLVKEILENERQARNSDDFLYYCICRERLAKRGLDINKVSIGDVLLNRKDYGIPAFESCRRARQKAQEQNPELASDEKIKLMREIREDVFRDFARKGLL